MLRNVLLKTLRDQRRSLPFWAIGMVLLAAFLAGFYPTVRDNTVFQEMVDTYPDELKGLMGLTDSMDISSGVGWLNIEAFGFMVPLVFIAYGVLAGAGAIAGEEGRGTLYLLLTEPVERGRVVSEKFGAMAAALAALCVVLYAALAVGAAATGMDDVGMVNLAAITASAALLGLVFGALALAIGCFTGRSGLAGGVSAAVAIAAHLVNAMRTSVEVLESVKWVSPFYYYNGADPLANGLDPLHALALAASAVALCAIGYLGFRRRDIAV